MQILDQLSLNDERYDRKLRWISLIGEYGFIILISGLVGGIAGFCIRFFGG